MKKRKLVCIVLLAAVLSFGGFISIAGIDAYAASDVTRQSYPDDLSFLSCCDNDILRTWDNTLGTLTDAQKKEIKSFIEQNIVTDSMNDYQKAQAVYEWIAANVTYADATTVISANPYDVFKNKIAVCGGYSNLYKAMLNLIDIPAALLIGNTTGGAHAWNAVYADDRWFYADTTWGSTDGTKWFDMSFSEFLSSHGTLRVEGVSVVYEDVRIGYDTGLAVVGVAEGKTTAAVPDTFNGKMLTRISYQLFSSDYQVKVLHIGKNVEWIDTQQSSMSLEAIHVSEQNAYYASSDGVLYTKDMHTILLYPSGKTDKTFVISKEIENIDFKDAFTNTHLESFEVESGNASYTAAEGLLYDKDRSTLLFVPAGQTKVKILKDAQISETAFANVEKDRITIYAELNSPAHEYALENNIDFADTSRWECPFADIKEEAYYYDAVRWAVENEITSGTSETTFSPKEDCTRAQVVMFLWRAAGSPNPKTTENPFTDVSSGSRFYKAVLWASENKITAGYKDGTFRPNDPVRRGEYVTLQWRAAGSPEPTQTENIFVDVNEKDFSHFYKAILWAVENQITEGKDATHFEPNKNCSRANVVTFLYRNA